MRDYNEYGNFMMIFESPKRKHWDVLFDLMTHDWEHLQNVEIDLSSLRFTNVKQRVGDQTWAYGNKPDQEFVWFIGWVVHGVSR